MAAPDKRRHARIALVDTGGTIGAVRDETATRIAEQSAASGWLSGDLEGVELVYRAPYRIFSENAHSRHWGQLASTIADLINAGVDGVVVMHGTDTLTYTAAALSFMLQLLPVPVVITGAMLPASDPDSDGRQNVRWSLRAALDARTPPEVCVMFGGGSTAVTAYYAGLDNFRDIYGTERLQQLLIRGTRVRKVSAWPSYFKPAEHRYAAFQSVHADILAAVPAGLDKLVYSSSFVAPSGGSAPDGRPPLVAKTAIDSRVLLLRIYPDIVPDLLVHLVKRRHYRGIILEAYGDGSLPSSEDYSLLAAIGASARLGAYIGVASPALGPVTMQMYPGGKEAIKLGAVPLLDMTAECAVVKLMWLLGQRYDRAAVRAQMERSLVGEMSVQAVMAAV